MDAIGRPVSELLASMRLVMGELPGNERRVPLDVRTLEERVGEGGVVLRKVTYAADASPDIRNYRVDCSKIAELIAGPPSGAWPKVR